MLSAAPSQNHFSSPFNPASYNYYYPPSSSQKLPKSPENIDSSSRDSVRNSMTRTRSQVKRTPSSTGASSSISRVSSRAQRTPDAPLPTPANSQSQSQSQPSHPIAPAEAIRMSEDAAARLPQPRPPITASSSNTPPPSSECPRLDIAKFPSVDLMKLLAALLSQISTANDALRASSPFPSPPASRSPPIARSSRHTSPPSSSQLRSRPVTQGSMVTSPTTSEASYLSSAARSKLSPSSLLTFHARNVPAITIEAYLLRILKYCPAPNDVFLSLLVYFDRMSKLALDLTGKAFAIDSYNVHRLIIAGVTVASKFWSDVFYTNSRYAKVGGLPQAELNQLELHFLLLNDFHLHIAIEEMQSYGDRLVHYSTNRQRLQNAHTLASLLPPTPPDALQSQEPKEQVREYNLVEHSAPEGMDAERMDVDEHEEDEPEDDEPEEDGEETVRLHSSSASEASTATGTPVYDIRDHARIADRGQ
ncbi:cyclin-domain-containing protein [Dacryopinax primogenitus]|uniref:Cyclin-domain-containing protein n=1 Tax=Dacryopinax primogenitus (strain DJM 731) TaxID=1858805 RepID=M5G1W4_DACPD|nr:cyclin-domain-containing protein [Dacryopinax primogenitus]EJT97742.1 cyclin-domain-containing protein [Dacryopinax primogenitus]